MSKLFITGTDTGIGKTHISKGLLTAYNKRGFTTVAMKPIASGSIKTKAGLRNEDALMLQEASSIKLPYEQINPFVFEAPMAPNIAAKQQGSTISMQEIKHHCKQFLQQKADLHLIEGAGGWQVPLTETEAWSDLLIHLPVKIILVVGMRLGCINHAILSYQAIKNSGCDLAAWVANCIDPNMLALEENIETIKAFLPIPLLGIVPYGEAAQDYLNLDLLSNGSFT